MTGEISRKTKQKFIIILSAGRAASTSLMNFLNQRDDTLIYGEGKGAIINLINTIHNFKRLQELEPDNIEQSINLDLIDYTSKEFIGNEHFYNSKKVEKIIGELTESFKDYFSSDHHNIGFKEITWGQFYNLEFLKIIEQIYEVKYIFLTRDEKSQMESMCKSFGQNEKQSLSHIRRCNKNIISLLEGLPRSKYLEINISKEKFIFDKITEFIYAKNFQT